MHTNYDFMGQKVNFDYPTAMRFRCTKCGICCGNTQEKIRHILLLGTETEQIAAATSQPISEFAVKFEGKAPYSHEIKKTAENGKCVFLKKNHCTIYSQRPLICRFYPFELKIVMNQKHEFLYTDECPGIGKGKKLGKNYFEKLFQLAHAKARAECRLSEEKC
jgi:Fe-S-cluster containining protein